MQKAASSPVTASARFESYHELPKRERNLTVAGLLLTLLLAALDQTIVGTAMPRIVAELQGFNHYAWVTTAYLLTSTSVVPIVGKLSDMYGRKQFLVGGAVFFVLSSMLCGLSQDMTQLIIFRGLQGLGGGMLMAMVFTVISSIFPPAERGKIQGLFGAVFGLASIGGPVIGGYLTDALSWRWVFYVNLPVGALALTVLMLEFPNIKPRHDVRPQIDYLGALSLVASVAPLLLALSWAGHEYPWGSPQVLGLLAVALVMLVAFVRLEAKAPQPIMPLRLFKNRTVSVAAAGLGVMSMGMFGSILFIPLFIQGVIGSSATESGTLLIPMMAMSIASSIVGGQIISRTGRYRTLGIIGMSIMALGMFLFSGLGQDADRSSVIRNLMIIGLGTGPTMPLFTLAAQNAVGFGELGVVTALTQFSRSIGGTLGAAVFGSLLTNRFGSALMTSIPSEVATKFPSDQLGQLVNPQVLLNPQTASAIKETFSLPGPQGLQLYESLMGAIKGALAVSLHEMFVVGSALLVVGAVLMLLLEDIPLRKSFAPSSSAGQTPGSAEAAHQTPRAQ